MSKNRRKRLEWLKLFPMDFWHGTEEMTNEEVGAYFRILCKAWMTSVNGNVPPHVPFRASAILAAMPGTSKRDWERIKRSVLEKFEIGTLDIKGEATKVLLNHRLTCEQEEALQDSQDQRDRVAKRYHGSTGVQPGYNHGATTVVPKEERILHTEQDTEQNAGRQEGSEDMAKEKALHKRLARIWQEEKGTDGAVCPYPHFQKDAFEDLARTHSADVLCDAFRLYAKDAPGADREKYPIDKFTMNANDWMLLARPVVAAEVSAEDKARKEREEANILRLAKESAERMRKPAAPVNEMTLDELLETE